MKHILFPTDFSQSSSQALNWACFLAKQYQATLVLIHVHQPPLPDTTLPTIGDLGVGMAASFDVEHITKEKLTELAEQLQQEGFQVRKSWCIGNIENEILDAATKFSADLIVIGRHTMTSFLDRLVGSAATDVALDAPCPVLVVPVSEKETGGKAPQLSDIVYATQLEFDERDIVQHVLALAAEFKAKVHFLKVDSDNQPNVYDDNTFVEQLQNVAKQPVKIETVHTHTVSSGLHQYLDHHKANLLVMTTRERGFLDGLLNPSLTERMVLRTHLPVLVYHTRQTNL